MASTQHYRQRTNGSLPVHVQGKQPHTPYVSPEARTSSSYSNYSASPPERPDSVSTSSAGIYSNASSQYAGSECDSLSSRSTSIDVLDYMNDRFAQAYNPLPLDRNLAKQAQMSGELNAKDRELAALQAQARARLATTKVKLAEGMKTARQVQSDLDWTQKKMQTLNARAAQKYPAQYRIARERYAVNDDY